MSREEAFFEKYKEFAIQQQIKYGIPASVTLAQAAIESSYGDNIAAKQANNFFGIHAVPAWLKRGDPVMYYNDASQHVPFTKHESAEASFEYHSKFLLLNNRQYGRCFGLSATDADGWAKGICEGGYAERKPGKEYAYYNSMMAVIKQNNLQKYDLEAAERAKSQNLVCGYDRKNISVDAPRPAVAAAPKNTSNTKFLDYQAGRWSMPVLADGNLKVTSDFGTRVHPVTGKRGDPHDAIDIGIPTGTKLVPTEDHGTVTRTNWNSSINGNCVEVKYNRGGDEYKIMYLHMSRVDVKAGDTVNTDTLLGLSGRSGRVTGPHLDFRVFKNGEAIDPKAYLAEIAVRGNLSTTLVNIRGKDLLADMKSDLAVAGQRPEEQQQMQHQNYDLAQQQYQGQQQQVSSPDGLTRYLFGDKDKQGWLNSFGGSGDLIADLLGILFKGTIALFAWHNMTSEKEVEQQMDQQKDKKVEEKYDATVDRSLVAEAKAKGIDPKVLEQQVALQADAGLGELDQQRQQQRGMSLG